VGGLADGKAIESLVRGFSHLGGAHCFLEGVHRGEESPRFGRPGHFLGEIGNFQSLAFVWAIEARLIELVQTYNFQGRTLKCSKAILQCSDAVYANFPSGRANQLNLEINRQQAPLPEEILKYIKDQLEAGKTWEGGLQQYFHLQYRGTVLYAALMRLMGQVALSYEFLKWARELITLVDDEFDVSKTGAYAKYGTCFDRGLRAGIQVAELYSLAMLRGDRTEGPYTVGDTLDLCLGITNLIHLEKEVPGPFNEGDLYAHTQSNVARIQKPLAFAHSVMASHLSLLREKTNTSYFTEQVFKMGFIGVNSVDQCDPFQIMAFHYRKAAENELGDAAKAAIYWWSYGSSISQAKASEFTIKHLVHAVSMAEKAERSRDVGLFGFNHQRGGSHEALSKLTLQHFQDESDSFVLPQVLLVKRADGITSLRLKDGTVICDDFSEYEKIDATYYQ
jgi:hypothetical protein